jgi:RNA polymerase sigma-70 factor (ECF subfamily)
MSDEDDRNFQDLYQYYRRVVYFFKQRGFSEEDARDLAQKVYIRVYKGMDTYRAEAKWNYLEKTARRLAINELRDAAAKKRSAVMVSDDALIIVGDSHVVPADVALQRRETLEMIGAAIEQIPSDQKACLLLYAQGFSYQEISRRLGVPESGVKSRLHDARNRLRLLLGDELEGFGDDS